MSKDYDSGVAECLRDVKNCQHLHYIGDIYRTKEVCLEALKAQFYYAFPLCDIGSVPMGNLDYVVEQLRILKKEDFTYLKELEEAYAKRKEREKEPGYYGAFPNLQAKLDHYGAVDCDDMYRKMFEQYKSEKNKKK
jgi:hypothetical protein